EGLRAEPAERAHVPEGRDTRDEREQHERRDHHLQKGDDDAPDDLENAADEDLLDESSAAAELAEKPSGDDAGRHRDQDFLREAHWRRLLSRSPRDRLAATAPVAVPPSGIRAPISAAALKPSDPAGILVNICLL